MRNIIVAFISILIFPSTLSAAEPLLDKVKIAVSQFAIEGDKSNKEFFAKITAVAEDAHKGGAQILVLPEWVTFDRWRTSKQTTDRKNIELIADQTTSPYFALLKKLAIKHQILIIGGTTAFRDGANIYNTAPIVYPSGTLQMQHKVFLTKWERDQKLAAGQSIDVRDTPYGKIAVLICYDSEFPSHSVELMKHRPEILIVPSMTESLAGVGRVRWSTQARVVEQTAFAVVAPTAGKTMEDWEHFGEALVLSPQLPVFPKPVLAIGDGKTHQLTFATLNLKRLREQRVSSVWQPAKDAKSR